MRKLLAKDVMSTEVVYVNENTTVTEAANLFVEEMISGAPVVDDEGNMTGVVSLRDFVKNGTTTQTLKENDKHSVYFEQSWELPLTDDDVANFHLETNQDLTVKEIMTPVVFHVNIDTPIPQLAEMMLRGRIHRVVVLDGDELAGIVTTMDMLKVISGKYAAHV